MRDAPPPILHRLYRKLRTVLLYPRYRQYRAGIGNAHPLSGIPSRIVGDASADPTEFFDHYDAFAYWVAQKIVERGQRLRILDLGSPKMLNGILSAQHDVTALVLADCGDSISNVQYLRHDVANKLPFEDARFDLFTSMVSLPLVGLGRYGDQLDPYCLVRLIGELGRVIKSDGELLVSMCLGPNILNFNNGWFFDFPTIERLFAGWHIVDRLVDQKSSPYGDTVDPSRRFTTDTSIDSIVFGDYRVMFLQLRRHAA